MEAGDPYEQQLLAVFESCDDYSQGSLSAAGLYQLCEKLQLEDHYNKLIKCLLGESKEKRVAFLEFRDGLLKLLNSPECDEKSSGGISPAREVSPKYVVGKKKYGRRSRPENNENESGLTDENDDPCQMLQSCSTDNDSDAEESAPKKRRARASHRRDVKMEKRFSGISSTVDKIQEVTSSTSTTSEEECLIAAWSNISKGTANCLSRDELVRVFQCVGLEESGAEEAAQCVFEKLEVEETSGITLQELLELIKSGVNWMKDVRPLQLETEACPKNASLDFADFASLGSITGANLVEQWENAGVPCAAQLLHNLGHSTSQQVDVASLGAVLSEELKSLNEDCKSSRRNLDPHVALLRASLVLQNIYVQSLKSMVEHMTAEKEKLRNDVAEANQRALLLAQEVDDHHSKLEHTSQQQVKILEQRHAEKIRELTLQVKAEQDALAAQNSQLERRISSLEDEESKCKTVITQLELENRMLEQEHRIVVDQLAAVQLVKEKLEKDLSSLSALQLKVAEMESTLNDRDVMSLLERIQSLESENTNLRDRNDELTAEVEELSAKMLNSSIKKRSSPNNSLCISVDESMEEESVGGGGGTKRRVESFGLLESADDSEGDEGSPRLGKVRKCSHVKDFALTTTSLQGLQIRGVTHGESLEDDTAEPQSAPKPQDVDACCGTNAEEVVNIPFSQELKQVGFERTESPSNNEESDTVSEIEGKLGKQDGTVEGELYFPSKLKANLVEMTCHVEDPDCGCPQKDEEIMKLEEELRTVREENDKEKEDLLTRCNNLESSLDLLKIEYEKTEDYWSEKLEEERALFEQEHKQSDEKYAELLDKIMEYEEMLTVEREQKQRLDTIEERVSFEKQVADMEQECYEMKASFTEALKEKDSEIEKLRAEIVRLHESNGRQDAAVQASNSSTDVTQSEDSQKSSSSEPSKKCKSYSKRSFTFSSGDRKNRYCSCRSNQTSKLLAEVKNLQESKSKYQHELNLLASERENLYKEILEKRRELNSYMAGGANSKLHYLEQRCHSLVVTIKQQQKQTEDMLKNTWKQHKNEVKDLKAVLKVTEDKLKQQTKVIQDQLNKLAKTDLLVKDLFVENAYLISSVQKLEQQCHTTYSPSKHSV